MTRQIPRNCSLEEVMECAKALQKHPGIVEMFALDAKGIGWGDEGKLVLSDFFSDYYDKKVENKPASRSQLTVAISLVHLVVIGEFPSLDDPKALDWLENNFRGKGIIK